MSEMDAVQVSQFHSDPSSRISEKEMRKKFGITEDDLKDFESVDIE